MGIHTFYTKDNKQNVFIGDISQLDIERASKEAQAKSPKQEYSALLTSEEKINFIAKKMELV